MIKELSIVVLLITCLKANAGELWSSDNLANTLMVSANTLIVIDWAQTRESSNKGYDEIGFAKHFIDSNPTTGEVNRYFVASLLTYNTINYLLPTKWKKWYSGSVATFELYVVNGNYQLGVGMEF